MMDALTAMKMARETLRNGILCGTEFTSALAALDAAIEQAEKAEPVAYTTEANLAAMQNGYTRSISAVDAKFAEAFGTAGKVPLYTNPAQSREPTDAELMARMPEPGLNSEPIYWFSRGQVLAAMRSAREWKP